MSPRTSRRTLLRAGAAGLVLGPGLGARPALAAQAPADPFTLGVASGDPRPTACVLWTRLAPDPLDTGSAACRHARRGATGRSPTDEGFTGVVARRHRVATPELGALGARGGQAGCEPGRDYFYRFRVGGQLSPVGRTRTRPAPEPAAMQSLAFAVVRLPVLARTASSPPTATWPSEDLDVVSTSATTSTSTASAPPAAGNGPVPDARSGSQSRTLDDYRIRYAHTRPTPTCRPRTPRIPWIVHLGRPRGGQQLRPATYGADGNGTARGVPAAPGRRPTRPTTSTCRCGRS